MGGMKTEVDRRSRTAVSCRGKQFIHDAVQAADGGGFAFIEMAEDGFADVDAKLFPSISLGQNGMAKGAGGEAAARVVLSDLKHDFAHGISIAEVWFM